jgi:hypothetical protein
MIPNFLALPLYYFDVVGDSMNALKPRPICWRPSDRDRVRVTSWASALRNGMVVVVEQTQQGGHLRERSVKQLEIFEDRYEFHPRSTNRKHELS